MKIQIEAFINKFPGWVGSLSLIFIALLVAVIIKLIINALLKHYKNIKGYSLISSVIIHLAKPLNYFLPVLMLNIVVPFLPISTYYLTPLNKLLEILLVVTFSNLLIYSVRIFEDFVYNSYDPNNTDNLKERKIRTQLQFIRKIVVTIIVIVGASIVLLSFDNVRKIGAGLLTGVGVGGIIIGFAAQKSLSNFLAGFQIAFTQPIRIDDVLVVEGEWGKVEEITLTYVVLHIWDQRRLILPINYFIEKPFQNWTRTTSQILGTVFLYMDYAIPVDILRAELTRLLNASELWDKRVGILQVTDAKEHTLELRALVSAKNSSNAFDLRCYIRENLIKFIKENSPESLPVNRLLFNNTEKEEHPTKS